MDKKLIYTGVAVLIVLGGIASIALNQKSRPSTSSSEPLVSISGVNETKNRPVTSAPASSQDFLKFTLAAQNQTTNPISGYVFRINLDNISDYASLVDTTNGSINSVTKILEWSALDIRPNESVEKNFVMRVSSLDPQTNKVVTLRFNNELHIAVSNVSLAQTTPVPTQTPTSAVKIIEAPVTGSNSGYLSLLALATVCGVIIRRRWKTIHTT